MHVETAAIFLSYRRQDVPGYVGRLADHLEAAFGQCVFRDVDDIGGGADWKAVLNQAVSDAKIVLAVIGERWQAILADRLNADADYIRFELNLARSLEKPVIPIHLQGTTFDSTRDMGDLNWLTELQFFELSDRQNRWDSDLEQLVQRIQQLTDLKPLAPADRDGNQSDSIVQRSSGNQSPNVVAKDGDVNIQFGDKAE